MLEYSDVAFAEPESGGEVEYPPVVDNDGTVVLAPPLSASDGRPAEERIADLFDHMPGLRGELISVIEACRSLRKEEELCDIVDALRERRHSVYSGLAFCRMLEKAGALRHVRENGDSFDEESLLPETVVEDGVEYIQAAVPPASYWVATEAGLAYAEADDPEMRARAVVRADEEYASVYKFILERCAQGGATGKELAGVIEAHPSTQEPRLYATHFIKKLEDAGAIAWNGSWVLSEKMSGSLGWLDEIAPLER